MENTYLTLAMTAAWQAGREIMDIYTDPASDFEVERKADNSPLTIADKRAHAIISGYLKQTPYPVLSEEGKTIPFETRRAWETLWIVDPLDGTKEFIKRNGEFTVNIALVSRGVPVLGVVYVPVTGAMYTAGETGAYRLSEIRTDSAAGGRSGEDSPAWTYRSEKLPCAAPHPGTVVVASRSHLSPETAAYIDDLKARGDVELVTSGSSLKICLVAEGAADVYPRFAPTMEWDTAAGHAVARAAGCQLYRYGSDEPLRYNKENLLNPWFIAQKVQPAK